MKPIFFYITAFILCSLQVTFSQVEILGSGIAVERLGDFCESNSVKATVVVYHAAQPTNTFPNNITLAWGDGTSDLLVSKSTDPVLHSIAYSIFEAEHTYSGPGGYLVSVFGLNSESDFVNVASTKTISFNPSVYFSLFGNSWMLCNSTPIAYNALFDRGITQFPLIYNLGADDADGDSLSYEMINPVPESDYFFPNDIQPSANNQLYYSDLTGTLDWDSPQQAGKYLVGMKVTAFRNDIPIDESIFWLTLEILDIDFTINPNPVGNELVMALLSAGGDEGFKLEIYNPLGQLCFLKNGQFDNGRYSIAMEDYPRGAYFLTLESLGRRWVKKFIKM